jgi:thiosulfate dehydrogenase [quinone] large subunit
MIVQLMDRLEQRAGRAMPVVLRVTLGLMWLANIHWKRPGDFGEADSSGLYKYLDPAKRGPSVFDPFTWLVDEVILPGFQLFGWVTLLTEIVLAAALLVGWKVRWMALLGAVQSLAIGLSVVNYTLVVEWPWSYLLMIAGHLALFGMAAGAVFGADGLRAGNAHRGWLAGGIVAALLGLWAIAKVGWDDTVTFAGTNGVLLGNEWGELKFMRVNGVGGLVLLAVGAVAIAAGLRKDRILGVVAAAVAAVVAVIGLVQWRKPVGGRETGGLLGIEGGAMAVAVALTLLFATAWWQSRPVTSAVDQ